MDVRKWIEARVKDGICRRVGGNVTPDQLVSAFYHTEIKCCADAFTPAITKLVEAMEEAVRDAEKAVNPRSRLLGYDNFKAALAELEKP